MPSVESSVAAGLVGGSPGLDCSRGFTLRFPASRLGLCGAHVTQ